MSEPALPRMSAPVMPDAWALPPRPEGASPVVQDTYRQTTFALGADLRLLSEGLNLVLDAARDAAPSRYRTPGLAAALLLGTRGWLAVSDATGLVLHGCYSSVPALVRSACEYIAAATQLQAEEQPAFLAWLAEMGLPDEELKATDIGAGGFFAGSTVAADPAFAAVYRAASELSRPHMGAALLLTAAESNRTRLAITFGDQTFHFGWAQIMLGWLLELCDVQARLLRAQGSDTFPLPAEWQARHDAWQSRARAALDQPPRARMTQAPTALGPRWLLSGMRRQSAGAARKYLV